MNKKIKIYILLLVLFFCLFWQKQSFCFVGEQASCTVYGTLTGLEYQGLEDHMGFYEKQAFQGDTAHHRTIIEYGQNNFCVNEPVEPKLLGTLRIMSFNVHNFHKICAQDGELCKHPKYAADIIKRINPDVVALEEVVPYVDDEKLASAHVNGGPISVNFSIIDALMHCVNFVHNVKVNDFERHSIQRLRSYFMGKAIYTKNDFPINAFSAAQLGHSITNDRGYVCILFEYAGKRILLYNVHLTFLNEFVTTMELHELVDFIQKDKKIFETENVLIVGDFNNNPYTDPQLFKALKNASYVLLNDKTPTSFVQNAQTGETIDLIYASRVFLDNFEVLNKKSDNPKGKWVVVAKSDASDHWPVFFDIRPKTYVADDEVVNKIFDSLKKKLFNTITPLSLGNTPDVELRDEPLALPISQDTKSQSLSHIRTYKGINVVDKNALNELMQEIRNEYFKFNRDHGVKQENIPEPNMDYLSKIVLNALRNEINLNDQYYVAYHAHAPELTILFDVYQQIYRWGSLNHLQPLALRLIKPFEFKNSRQIFENFLNQASLLTRNESGFYVFDKEKHQYFDMLPMVSSLVLSLNLSLFANMRDTGASSLVFGLSGNSFMKINTEEKLAQILRDCNIGESFVSKILRLKQQFLRKQKKGVLLQLFIKKEVVDNVLYISNIGGRPFDIENQHVKASYFLEQFISEPQKLNKTLNAFMDEDRKFVPCGNRSLDQIQARLWTPAEELYDERCVIVKRYNFDSADYVDKDYYIKLNEIFEEIVKDIIRNKLLNKIDHHCLIQTPFKNLEREIERLILEEHERIHFRDQAIGIDELVDDIPQKIYTTFQLELENIFYNLVKHVQVDIGAQENIKAILTSDLYKKTLNLASNKMTPLMMAVTMSSLPLVKFLLSIEGYDPLFNVKRRSGQTALYWAKMNASSFTSNEILDCLIKYVEEHPFLLDSMTASDMAVIASRTDSMRSKILKRLNAILFHDDPDLITMVKELIKNSNELELIGITDEIFLAIAKSETSREQVTTLNLLKLVIVCEHQSEENINKALDVSFESSKSKILIVRKAALDLQNIIGKKLFAFYLGGHRKNPQDLHNLVSKNDIENLVSAYMKKEVISLNELGRRLNISAEQAALVKKGEAFLTRTNFERICSLLNLNPYSKS